MGGTLTGGKKAAATNKKKYGEDYYHRLGKISGKLGKKDGVIKGFALNPKLASIAGRKGGLKSKRGQKVS